LVDGSRARQEAARMPDIKKKMALDVSYRNDIISMSRPTLP
jgi:hypothetical protein